MRSLLLKRRLPVMMGHLMILVILWINPLGVCAQDFLSTDGTLLNGFSRKISGDDFSYHSSIPNVEKSLIVRATNGKYAMEWETASVPVSLKEKYVTFAWLAAIGSSPGVAKMELRTNNGNIFHFLTDGQKSWSIKDDGGAELSFRSSMQDQVGDQFGFIFLRIPSSQLTKGKPISIKVIGGDDQKSSWYMTFQQPIVSGLTMKTYPAILKEKGESKQLASGNLLYFGAPQEVAIFLDGKQVSKQSVKFGSNYIRLGIPEAKTKKIHRVKIEGNQLKEEITLEQFPIRKWQVNFVQHSHTDIGYTRSQTEILAEHLRYIDYALDYCDATDSYPEESKFRWVCEASWAVDEYLKCRPAEQIERFKKRVKEGRIEIGAMYYNFDELPDEQSLAASLEPLRKFKTMGIAPKMAMQNDVNGIAWCMNDYYSDLGVRYLNMGTHGHRALICFPYPTLFWWESPSGHRMLAFRGEHYMTGNTTFEMDKNDLPNFESKLLNYLTSLGEKGYPYDLISIQHSGYLTDNSPPSTTASELIRKWNATYEWPKLRTALASDFFETMEKSSASKFPVYRGAWPDWWTDGFGASAREVAALRKAQSDITAFEGGLAMANLMDIQIPKGINDRINLANNASLFYAEHTVGYSESVREPYHEQTMEQRAIKESYAWEAHRRAKMIGEEVMGLLQSKFQKEPKASIIVYNTLNWNRDGIATVYIDHQLVPRGMMPRLTDKEGNVYPVQPLSHRSDGTYWSIWLKGIPPFGYKKLLVDPVDFQIPITQKEASKKYETSWYSLEIDPSKGAITSWYDKELNLELVDKNSPHKLGEFIYERLGNRYQMEQKRLDDFKRFPLEKAWFDSYTEGPIWNTLKIKGTSSATVKDHPIEITIKLFNTSKRISIDYDIVKDPIVDPEGIYIAFPFTLPQGKLRFDVQGGVVEAGVDQIPGSSNDWNTVQNYATLGNSTSQIVISSQEVPLMQFGGINTGRYKAGAKPESTHLYSWPMNNYWTTNFNPDQKGEHLWNYQLTSLTNSSNVSATRFGWETRIPFLTRILPGGGHGDSRSSGSFLDGWPENVLLVNATLGPIPNTLLIHVREVGGKSADMGGLVTPDHQKLEIYPVNLLGVKLENVGLQVKPFGNQVFMVRW